MTTGRVLTALVYGTRRVNEPERSRLAALPAGTAQLDVVIVTSQSIAVSPDYGVSMQVFASGMNGENFRRIMNNPGGVGDPSYVPPQKAGGAIGEILADVNETWEIVWDENADQPWGGGVFTGRGILPSEGIDRVAVDVTLTSGPGGAASFAVIMIARDQNGVTLDWSPNWIGRPG